MRVAQLMFAVSLTFAGAVIAEDLPSKVVLLSQIKIRLREELTQLSNISCLETYDAKSKRAAARRDRSIRFAWKYLLMGRKSYSHRQVTANFLTSTRLTSLGAVFWVTGFLGYT